jgi:hypothetical protein
MLIQIEIRKCSKKNASFGMLSRYCISQRGKINATDRERSTAAISIPENSLMSKQFNAIRRRRPP